MVKSLRSRRKDTEKSGACLHQDAESLDQIEYIRQASLLAICFEAPLAPMFSPLFSPACRETSCNKSDTRHLFLAMLAAAFFATKYLNRIKPRNFKAHTRSKAVPCRISWLSPTHGFQISAPLHLNFGQPAAIGLTQRRAKRSHSLHCFECSG